MSIIGLIFFYLSSGLNYAAQSINANRKNLIKVKIKGNGNNVSISYDFDNRHSPD